MGGRISEGVRYGECPLREVPFVELIAFSTVLAGFQQPKLVCGELSSSYTSQQYFCDHGGSVKFEKEAMCQQTTVD